MDLDEIEGFDEPRAKDFRRANGAPLVRKLDDPTRWDRYSRPSTWGHDLDDESALTLWKIDRACDGVASSPALAAQIAAIHGRTDGRTELRERAIQLGRGEEAADLGTALHALAHRFETEPGFPVPEPHASDLACYLLELERAGLESTHFECHICADQWRAAGTADRIYRARRELRLPDGQTVLPGTSFIGDLKTGSKLTYNVPGFCIQLAIYADGVFYDVDTDVRSPMPADLHTGWGVLVHLPAGRADCTLYWVDLETGRAGARIVQQVRAWRKRDDFLAEFAFPVDDTVAVLSSPIYDLEQIAKDVGHKIYNDEIRGDGDTAFKGLSELVEHPMLDPVEASAVDSVDDESEDVDWVTAMLPWCQARINQIGQLSDPRAHLLRAWPTNVPPLRAGTPSARQLSLILDLLDTIEGAYSLPFVEGDPRVEWNAGLHRDDVVRGNQPSSTKDQES